MAKMTPLKTLKISQKSDDLFEKNFGENIFSYFQKL